MAWTYPECTPTHTKKSYAGTVVLLLKYGMVLEHLRCRSTTRQLGTSCAVLGRNLGASHRTLVSSQYWLVIKEQTCLLPCVLTSYHVIFVLLCLAMSYYVIVPVTMPSAIAGSL